MIDINFFRNPEIRRSFLLYLILMAIFSTIGFLSGVSTGAPVFFVCLVFVFLHFSITYKRYLRIKELSNEIDHILHGKKAIHLSEYSEGELSILQSEILKLTLTLREQAETLHQDKIYLNDSIADISHQIRTPLTGVNLIITLLSRQGLTDEHKTELIKELEQLLSRIDWLISALLKISKLDSGTTKLQSKVVSVAELINRAVSPIAIAMELREQQIDIQMSGDETYIGDLSWTVEAIANILKNCMEHTPAGGKIIITALENAIYTEIIICDNGSGIDKEDLLYLFERFYKGKNSSDGSVGIGLALARIIIARQNGTIKAENLNEGGAKFTIRFYKGAV